MKRAILLLSLLCLTLPAFSQKGRAPDFTLPDLDGENYNLTKNLGEGPTLINFWATWCVPCRAEMRKLKKVHARYEKQGLRILSISIDDPKTVGKVRSYVNTNRFPYKFLLDTNQKVFKLYQGANPPLSVLLDAKGQVVYSHQGYRKGDEKKLEEKIKALIPAKKSPEGEQ